MVVNEHGKNRPAGGSVSIGGNLTMRDLTLLLA